MDSAYSKARNDTVKRRKKKGIENEPDKQKGMSRDDKTFFGHAVEVDGDGTVYVINGSNGYGRTERYAMSS